MNKGLMERDDWKNLGMADIEKVEKTSNAALEKTSKG